MNPNEARLTEVINIISAISDENDYLFIDSLALIACC